MNRSSQGFHLLYNGGSPRHDKVLLFRDLTHDGDHFILMPMSKRLQVILDDKEMRDIQRTAKRQQMTVAEWVRQALRAAQRQVPLTDTKKKLGVVRAAARHDFPTGDIDQMLREINQGYQIETPS